MLLENAAVSTAGDAERFVVIDGHRYSHIINPKTGMGLEDRAASRSSPPTARPPTRWRRPSISSGPERGLKLVDETPGAAAIFVRVTPEGVKTFESSRFRQVPKVEGQETTGAADVSRP